MYISFVISSVRKGIFLLTLAVFISFPGFPAAQEISFPELQGYEVGPDIFSLFIIETKTPSDTWKIAEAYLGQAGEDVPESETGKYVLSDIYNGTVFLAWADKTIVIIKGLSKDQSDIADQYTSEIIK